MIRFTGILERPEGVNTWTYVDIPFNTAEAFGLKGQIRIKGSVNGCPFRSTLMPDGEGGHYLVVNKALRESIGRNSGETVDIELEPDTEPRAVTVPDDLSAALECNQLALEQFNRFSYTQQKLYIDWLDSAKAEKTRAVRVAKAVEKLARGEKAR